ncbi:cell division protein FtsX [Nitrosomonas stercoris]|uniref:Cell division protein FtsX n=1 Tax=Nitrosomonas stercoris TaxID=1444684 RepID=A0A4Y1YQY4_9PROT|nr:cell division protein FtsX [Nitrosomonas stercoris]
MINWLSQHGYALSRALKQLIATPTTSLLSVIVFSIVLSFPAGIYILLENLQAVSDRTTEVQQMTLVLETSASQADIEQINNRLEQLTTVKGFQFISKEIALQELEQESGMAEVMHNLGQNPLPDVFVIDLGNISVNEIEQMKTDLLNWPKVEHVLVDTDWARKLNTVLMIGKLVVSVLASLFAVTLVIVMFNTIRLQILTCYDEIELSKLIGATDSYIQRPFLYFGAVQGMVGATLAWLLLYFVIMELNKILFELAQLYATTLTIHHLSWRDSLILLCLSGGLGWIGARWSVARHLAQVN